MVSRFFFLFILFYFFAACEKAEIKEQAGIILFSGTYQEDGCGYILQVGSDNYFPRNLSDTYKSDSLFVEVRFDKLEDFEFCGLGQEPLQVVNIRGINSLD